MDAGSIVQLEGSFSWADAFLRLFAPDFVFRANEASAISKVKVSIAVHAFVFVVEEGFHWRAGAFLCLGIHLEALRTSEAGMSFIVPKVRLWA